MRLCVRKQESEENRLPPAYRSGLWMRGSAGRPFQAINARGERRVSSCEPRECARGKIRQDLSQATSWLPGIVRCTRFLFFVHRYCLVVNKIYDLSETLAWDAKFFSPSTKRSRTLPIWYKDLISCHLVVRHWLPPKLTSSDSHIAPKVCGQNRYIPCNYNVVKIPWTGMREYWKFMAEKICFFNSNGELDFFTCEQYWIGTIVWYFVELCSAKIRAQVQLLRCKTPRKCKKYATLIKKI